MTLETLPPEIKYMIMKKLSQQDLCNIALVSKNLNGLALDKKLWKELKINENIAIKLSEEGADALQVTRFKKIKSIKLVSLPNNMTPKVRKELFKIMEKVERVDLSELNSRNVNGIVRKVALTDSIAELVLNDENAECLASLQFEVLTKALKKAKNRHSLNYLHFFVD